jgi:coenzyme F420-dependent glucose-6-phosphate dehydrogenase
MATIGCFFSCEERTAPEIVEIAGRAEQAGFETAWISDHFHPWNDEQGQSPFVWAVLGGIAAATDRLRVHTAVTCPTVRMHPAIVAQAAATVATMMPGSGSASAAARRSMSTSSAIPGRLRTCGWRCSRRRSR